MIAIIINAIPKKRLLHFVFVNESAIDFLERGGRVAEFDLLFETSVKIKIAMMVIIKPKAIVEKKPQKVIIELLLYRI